VADTWDNNDGTWADFNIHWAVSAWVETSTSNLFATFDAYIPTPHVVFAVPNSYLQVFAADPRWQHRVEVTPSALLTIYDTDPGIYTPSGTQTKVSTGVLDLLAIYNAFAQLGPFPDTPAERSFIIAMEDRSIYVMVEDRTITVPSEDRTIVIRD